MKILIEYISILNIIRIDHRREESIHHHLLVQHYQIPHCCTFVFFSTSYNVCLATIGVWFLLLNSYASFCRYFKKNISPLLYTILDHIICICNNDFFVLFYSFLHSFQKSRPPSLSARHSSLVFKSNNSISSTLSAHSNKSSTAGLSLLPVNENEESYSNNENVNYGPLPTKESESQLSHHLTNTNSNELGTENEANNSLQRSLSTNKTIQNIIEMFNHSECIDSIPSAPL